MQCHSIHVSFTRDSIQVNLLRKVGTVAALAVYPELALHLTRGPLGRPGPLLPYVRIMIVTRGCPEGVRHVGVGARVIFLLCYFLLRCAFVKRVRVGLRDSAVLIGPTLHLRVAELFKNGLMGRNLFLLLFQMPLMGRNSQGISEVFLDIPTTKLLFYIAHYCHNAFNLSVKYFALIQVAKRDALRLLAILILNYLTALHVMGSLVRYGRLNSVSAGLCRNLTFHVASLEILLDESLAVLANGLVSVG
jgi:hypothetical protein